MQSEMGLGMVPPVRVLKIPFPSPTHRMNGGSSRIKAAVPVAAADTSCDCSSCIDSSSGHSRPGRSPAGPLPSSPPEGGDISRSNSSLSSSSGSTCVSCAPQGDSCFGLVPTANNSSSNFKFSKKRRERVGPVEVIVPSCIYFTQDPLTGRPQPPLSPQQQRQQQRTQRELAAAAASCPSALKAHERPEQQELQQPAAAGDRESPEPQQWGSRLSFLMASLGAAVGIGSVWRFPAYCYKWGGGAFLVPYLLLLLLLGVPLLGVEMALGQVFRGGHMRVLSLLSPSLRGLAAATLLLSFCICSYYSVFLAWGLLYLFSSFSPSLPWVLSNEETALCSMSSLQHEAACLAARAAGAFCQWDAAAAAPAAAAVAVAGGRCVVDVEAKAAAFFAKEVLQQPAAAGSAATASGLSLTWPTVLCLVLVWVCVFLALSRGLRGLKFLCYLSVLLPAFCVLLLMVRAVSLPGASLGVSRLFSLDVGVLLKNPEVWAEAASQVFFSLGVFQGVMSSYASHKPPTQNTTLDALAVAGCNAALSLVSAVAAFAVAGHVVSGGGGSPEGDPAAWDRWDRLRLEGPQLVFVLYPMALVSLPAPHLFCIAFFVAFVLLGISSVASLIQPSIDLLLQSHLLARKAKLRHVSLGLCISCCLLGLFFCFPSAVVVLETADYHWGVVGLLLVGTAETLAFGWVYGLGRQRRHVGARAAYGLLAVYVSAVLIACTFGLFGSSTAATAAGIGAAAALLLGGAAICLSFALIYSSHKQKQKAAVAAVAAAAAEAAAVYREELAAVVGDDFAVCGFVDAAAATKRTRHRAVAQAAAEGDIDSISSTGEEGQGSVALPLPTVSSAATPTASPALAIPSSCCSATITSSDSSSSSSGANGVRAGIGPVSFWLFWGNVEHLRRNLNVITAGDRRSLRLRPAWSLLLKYILPAVVCLLLFQTLKRGTQCLPKMAATTAAADPTATTTPPPPGEAAPPTGASWAFQGPTVAVLLVVVLVTAVGIVWPTLFSPLIPADMETGSSRVAAAIAGNRKHPFRQPVKAAAAAAQQQQQQQHSSKAGDSGKTIPDDEVNTQASDLPLL